jgi:hypothetical protein
MTLATGQRAFHFKNAHPTDPNLTPFADWLPANKNFCRVPHLA